MSECITKQWLKNEIKTCLSRTCSNVYTVDSDVQTNFGDMIVASQTFKKSNATWVWQVKQNGVAITAVSEPEMDNILNVLFIVNNIPNIISVKNIYYISEVITQFLKDNVITYVAAYNEPATDHDEGSIEGTCEAQTTALFIPKGTYSYGIKDKIDENYNTTDIQTYFTSLISLLLDSISTFTSYKCLTYTVSMSQQ